METSHRPLSSQLLPDPSYPGPYHIIKALIRSFLPAKPRRMCSYVADPAWSLCIHRKTGSSGTATHCKAQHCISQHWDFNALNSTLWIPLSHCQLCCHGCSRRPSVNQCELILIATHWPQVMWFPLLLGILVQSPLQIRNITRLL